MTCPISWAVGRTDSGENYATLYCPPCMAPIRHRLTLGAARELRTELLEHGHLCRRQHALPEPVRQQLTTTQDIEAEMAGRKG